MGLVCAIAARTPDAVPGVIASAPPIGRKDAAVIAAEAAVARISFRIAFLPCRDLQKSPG
jgi:hypothetical protein